jgi:hypothetical protein
MPMRTLEVTLRLNLPERIADDSETIAVNGRPVKVPCDRLTALIGAFGAGDTTITGGDAIDALAMLHEPFPRWMFHLAKHLRLVHFVKPNAPSPLPDSQREAWFEKDEMPCHIGCNNYYDYYVFGYVLPYVTGAPFDRVYLTDEFLSTPRLPDFKTHIPESENARIAYFIHTLPNRHAELNQWMLLHQKELVCFLRELKREYKNPHPLQYIIYRNPRAVAMWDYRADVALTLGRWYMVGGSELMTALRDQGGLPFIRDAGLSEVVNNA